ncbi:hypothetical protein D9M71_658640 [compost metagenome]
MKKLLSQPDEGFRAMGQAFVQFAGEGIDGVVSAPENAVFPGLAPVMELVAGIDDAVASFPADAL